MRFDSVIIQNVVAKLLQGDDYREEVINAINLEFLDFALNLEWYKTHFIIIQNLNPMRRLFMQE